MKILQNRLSIGVLTLCVLFLSLLCNVSVDAQTPARPTPSPSATPTTATTKASAVTSQSSGQKYLLKSSRQVNSIDIVSYAQSIGGFLMVPSEKDPKTINKFPVKAMTQMVYTEKTVMNGQKNGVFAIQAIRNYRKINTKRTINDDTDDLTLSKEKSLLCVDVNGSYCVFYHPQYCMTRSELDALEVMGSSLILDAFLPSEPVAVNEEWSITEEAVASLLQLDRLSQAEVSQILSAVNGTKATIIARGEKIVGISEGVRTEIDEFQLTYEFDLQLKRITSATLETTVRRSEGPISQPWALKSIVKISIKPIPASSDPVLAKATWTPQTPELLLLHFDTVDGSWSMFHNRNWHVIQDEPNQTVCRFMNNGQFIAQCVINKPVDTPQTRAMTLEQFKEQVEAVVKEDPASASNRKIEFAGEEVSPITKNKVYQVIVSDSKDGSMWSYYMVKGKPNEQIVFMFMLDSNSAELIGTTDSEMAGLLTFNSIAQPTSQNTPESQNTPTSTK